MNLMRWTGFSYALFGRRAEKRATQVPDLGQRLQQARIMVSPAAYLAFGDLVALVVTAVTLVLTMAVLALVPIPNLWLLIATIVFSAWAAYATTQLSFMIRPRLKARARARSIELNLPYAAGFAASYAASGATPKDIFQALAREDMYGEVSREATWIYRDTNLLGIDIVTALSQAAQRSPSRVYAEFLHGTAYTISTGGDLKTYFMGKASQLAEGAHRQQRKFSETLAILSETYVTVAVAGPLFLIVVLSVMTLSSRRGGDTLWYLNLVAFVMLPLLHLGFALVLKQAKPEA